MTILDQLRRQWTAPSSQTKTSGGSPGDHAPARFPSEPPSLARPTPQGRAMAAQRGGASPWWARALATLERSAPWMFEPVPADQLHLYVRESRPADLPSHPALRSAVEKQTTETRSRPPSSFAPASGMERSNHASASRPLSVRSRDPATASDGGSPPRVKVTDSRGRAGAVSEPDQQSASVRRSEPAPGIKHPVTAAARTRPRHSIRVACDIHALLSDNNATAAGGRACSGACARPAAARCRNPRRGQTLTDRSQPDGASGGGAGR